MTAPGNFKWNEDFDVDNWDDDLLKELSKQFEELDRKGGSSHRQAVTFSHTSVCQDLSRNCANSEAFTDLKIQSICIACLFNTPQYKLNCGHLLCLDCCRDFGTEQGCHISVSKCPLHIQSLGQEYPHALIDIVLPPRYSGLRVLTLDG